MKESNIFIKSDSLDKRLKLEGFKEAKSKLLKTSKRDNSSLNKYGNNFSRFLEIIAKYEFIFSFVSMQTMRKYRGNISRPNICTRDN